MTGYAYRPCFKWMQGTELRAIDCSELLTFDEIYPFADRVSSIRVHDDLLTFEGKVGHLYSVPGRLLTEITYRREELSPRKQPTTTTDDSNGARDCPSWPAQCTCVHNRAPQYTDPDAQPDPTPSGPGCCDPVATPAEAERYADVTVQNMAFRMGPVTAEQEARHPGLSRLLTAVMTQLPPDDPQRCAETLAAMDARQAAETRACGETVAQGMDLFRCPQSAGHAPPCGRPPAGDDTAQGDA